MEGWKYKERWKYVEQWEYSDISAICRNQCEEVCKTLPVLHTFSGFDNQQVLWERKEDFFFNFK